MSAMPMGIPGWPELARCTASMDSARMALASSRRVVIAVLYIGGLKAAAAVFKGDRRHARGQAAQRQGARIFHHSRPMLKSATRLKFPALSAKLRACFTLWAACI